MNESTESATTTRVKKLTKKEEKKEEKEELRTSSEGKTNARKRLKKSQSIEVMEVNVPTAEYKAHPHFLLKEKGYTHAPFTHHTHITAHTDSQNNQIYAPS